MPNNGESHVLESEELIEAGIEPTTTCSSDFKSTTWAHPGQSWFCFSAELCETDWFFLSDGETFSSQSVFIRSVRFLFSFRRLFGPAHVPASARPQPGPGLGSAGLGSPSSWRWKPKLSKQKNIVLGWIFGEAASRIDEYLNTLTQKVRVSACVRVCSCRKERYIEREREKERALSGSAYLTKVLAGCLFLSSHLYLAPLSWDF